MNHDVPWLSRCALFTIQQSPEALRDQGHEPSLIDLPDIELARVVQDHPHDIPVRVQVGVAALLGRPGRTAPSAGEDPFADSVMNPLVIRYEVARYLSTMTLSPLPPSELSRRACT